MNYNYKADALPAEPEPSEETAPEIEGEVEEDAPETPETVETPVPSEEAEGVSDAPAMAFSRNDRDFYLEETNNGYRFFQKDMEEPFAVLVKSGKGDDFLYNSVSKQGKAYFAQNGDLIVEHFDPATEEIVKTTYSAKEDQ